MSRKGKIRNYREFYYLGFSNVLHAYFKKWKSLNKNEKKKYFDYD